MITTEASVVVGEGEKEVWSRGKRVRVFILTRGQLKFGSVQFTSNGLT